MKTKIILISIILLVLGYTVISMTNKSDDVVITTTLPDDAKLMKDEINKSIIDGFFDGEVPDSTYLIK